jgi:hypothetical protein
MEPVQKAHLTQPIRLVALVAVECSGLAELEECTAAHLEMEETQQVMVLAAEVALAVLIHTVLVGPEVPA